MRRFRMLLSFLLAIAVPLQGYAYFALPQAHCPMGQAAMMEKMDTAIAHDCCDDADTFAHDCCDDEDAAANTGKACKCGQPSHSASQFFPITELGVLPQDAAPSVRFQHLAESTFSFDPDATWRPPAQL